jgi:asparaginyl-tRNA synthetase
MIRRKKIKNIQPSDIGQEITLCGWVRTVRDQKSFLFIEVNDGSTLSNLQVIADEALKDDKIATGASICITGVLVESPGHKQKWELKAQQIRVLGECPQEEYPLQKKRHSFEFLRTIAHLRPRTNTQGAVLRIRNALAFATHLFFQDKGFLWVHTPIITASDCEGGGEQFLVTTLNLEKVPKLPEGGVDFSKDFFGQAAYLTVSGQLNGETVASALSDIYTFGPTFRAENSHTSRHLAEFWMIEPEMAFADLKDNITIAEEYLKFVTRYVLKNCSEDMEFFDAFIERGLLERLRNVESSSFAQLSYTDAVEILLKAPRTFEFPVSWGCDLQSEHERYLSEEYCKKPVILTDYPQKIKAFYMRDNEDGKTVAAMDVLVPKIGELMGGSQREERLEILEKKIIAHGLDPKLYWWYLQLRKYGTVPHAGFGVGFERLILYITGMENIRDVIPFPRFPSHADF